MKPNGVCIGASIVQFVIQSSLSSPIIGPLPLPSAFPPVTIFPLTCEFLIATPVSPNPTIPPTPSIPDAVISESVTEHPSIVPIVNPTIPPV